MEKIDTSEVTKEMKTLQKFLRMMAENQTADTIDQALSDLEKGSVESAKGVCESLISKGSHLTYFPALKKLAGLG